MYRNIVIGYDGSDHARDAAALGLALGRAVGARLTFVNAFDDVPAPLPADEMRHHLREQAERTLQEMTHSLTGKVSVDKKLLIGRSSARALYEFAETCHADLIVLGSSRQAPEGRVTTGRVASQVLHGAPCAVALAPAGLRKGGELGLRVVGVGFDGQPEAETALSVAAAIAQTAGARLRIIAVVEPAKPLTGRGGIEAQEGIQESLKVSAREALDRAGTQVPAGVEVSRSLLSGPVSETLAQEAVSCGLDLLVVGSRGFGPVRRVLLGSVSTELMHMAPCSLMVLPRRAAASLGSAGDEARAVDAR